MKLPDAATYRLRPLVLRLRAERRKHERSNPGMAAGVEMLAREVARIGRQGAVDPCGFDDESEGELLVHLLAFIKELNRRAEPPLESLELEAVDALIQLVESWPPWFAGGRRLRPVPPDVTLPGSLFPWMPKGPSRGGRF
jgi:hypothetical protein